MAEIIMERSSNQQQKWIGCIELSEDMNRTIRQEAIINVKERLERRGYVLEDDFDQGADQHVFVYREREGSVSFPEKPSMDWEEAIQPYRSVYHEADQVVSI